MLWLFSKAFTTWSWPKGKEAIYVSKAFPHLLYIWISISTAYIGTSRESIYWIYNISHQCSDFSFSSFFKIFLGKMKENGYTKVFKHKIIQKIILRGIPENWIIFAVFQGSYILKQVHWISEDDYFLLTAQMETLWGFWANVDSK